MDEDEEEEEEEDAIVCVENGYCSLFTEPTRYERGIEEEEEAEEAELMDELVLEGVTMDGAVDG